MNTFFQRLAPALALSLPLLAIARPAADPADAHAPAQPLRYESAFADYKPWRNVERGDWRRLNDDLRPAAGATGSHAGHGNAAPAASHGAASAAVPAPRASAPALPAHRGHRMHGGQP